MAVIVLENADFSANNIGSIELKKAFSPLTKKIIARYGKTVDEDDSQQIALNNFVVTLINAGLLGVTGKIKSLCLPFMGSEIGVATIDALSGDNFFTADVSSSLELASNGIKPIAGQSVVNVNLLNIFPTVPSNFHLAAYNTTVETQEINQSNNRPINKSVFGFGAISSAKIETLNKVLSNSTYPTGRPALNIDMALNIVVGDANYLWTKNLMIGNVTATGNSFCCNGQIVKNTTPSQKSGWNNPIFGIYNGSTYADLTAINATYTKANWGLLSIGDALTDAECQTYNNAVEELFSSI